MQAERDVRIETLAVLPAELVDQAWQFYIETFGGLAVLAVTRHVLYREEFDHLMADTRVTKWVAIDGDTVVGMAAMTTDLSTLPLLSHDFFAHRWPQEYTQRRIVYCLFIGVRSGPDGKGVFVGLQERMYELVQGVRGMAVLDFCAYNEVERQLPGTVEKILKSIAGDVTATRLDAQSYWVYEFPAAS